LSLLDFKNVSYANGGQTILSNLTFSIHSGDFLSITGPSGSGKSTFLKLCSHLISPVEGEIQFKGKDLNDYNPAELRRRIAYCFQTPFLFGETVRENMDFPFIVRNAKPDHRRVNELLSLFQMENEYLDKEVKNLSGGEKQRLALIRSLIFEPEILLLDEVTSSLDANNALIAEHVIAMMNEKGISVLWVTHNPEQIQKYANRLLTLEAGKIKSLEAKI